MTLLDALSGPRVLVMDAAMGTALLAAGVRSVNAAPLTHPGLVQSIHAAYVRAGAEVVLTCTFQYNPAALAREGLLRQRERLYAAAVERARAGEARFVVGAIGPVYSTSGWNEVLDREVLGWGLAPHMPVDGYLLETWSSPTALASAGYLSCLPAPFLRPVLLSLTYQRDTNGALVTHSGHPPEHFAREAKSHGVASLGVNCGRDIGPRDIIEILRRYRQETDLPLFARPNAGAPGPDGSYPMTPEALAEAVPEMVAAGARMIGGCCGTTAAHVAAVAKALNPTPQPPSSRGEGGRVRRSV